MVLAVAAAGGALVLAAGDEPAEEPEPDTATKYATIDLGNQPDHVVEEIDEGDSVDLGGQSSLTITDMHATPVANHDDNPALSDPELLHKVVHACMHSDVISEDEELHLVMELL